MPSVRVHFLVTDEQIKNLCDLYWTVDENQKFSYTVSELATTFSMKSSELSKLVAESCQAYSEENVCNRCHKPSIYSNRSDFQSRWKAAINDRSCLQCVAEQAEARRVERLAEIQRQHQAIQDHYALSPQPPLEIGSVSFEYAVYLLSFIRTTASENLLVYGPLITTKEPLSPNTDFSFEIVRQLYRSGLIAVHPNSQVDAFKFNNGEPNTFYVDKVLWSLDFGGSSEETQGTVTELERIFRTEEWPEHWYSERLLLWKKLALQECLTYLKVVLNEHGLDLTPGEKTYMVFNNVLEEYSVGQVYNMIWRAGRDAAAFYMRGGVSKPHASNTVVGSIQKQADKARAEGWETKAYRRDRRCPESVLSQTLFNTALKIGEEGFNLPPIASSLDS